MAAGWVKPEFGLQRVVFVVLITVNSDGVFNLPDASSFSLLISKPLRYMLKKPRSPGVKAAIVGNKMDLNLFWGKAKIAVFKAVSTF
jgi:hypothetical protein